MHSIFSYEFLHLFTICQIKLVLGKLKLETDTQSNEKQRAINADLVLTAEGIQSNYAAGKLDSLVKNTGFVICKYSPVLPNTND